jgi:hypothetical protein
MESNQVESFAYIKPQKINDLEYAIQTMRLLSHQGCILEDTAGGLKRAGRMDAEAG